MKPTRPSNELLANAFDLSLGEIRFCQVAENYIEFYVRCGSGLHGHHVVTQTANNVYCDCESYTICKHILSSAGRPLLHFAMQCRWANDAESVKEAVQLYAPSLRTLPESLRVIARLEKAHAESRFEGQEETDTRLHIEGSIGGHTHGSDQAQRLAARGAA